MSLINELENAAEWVGQHGGFTYTARTSWRHESEAVRRLVALSEPTTIHGPGIFGGYGVVQHIPPPITLHFGGTSVQTDSALSDEGIGRFEQLGFWHKALQFRINLAGSVRHTETPLLEMIVESYAKEMRELSDKIEKELSDAGFLRDQTKTNVTEEKQKFIRQTISWLISEINNTKAFSTHEAMAVIKDICRLISWDGNDKFIGGFTSRKCDIETAVCFFKREYQAEERTCPHCGKTTIHGCKSCLHCGSIIGV